MSYTDNFDKDYDQLKNDLLKLQQEQQAYLDMVKKYHEEMAKIAKTKDAAKAFTMLMYLISSEGTAQWNAQMTVDAGGLKIQGDLTKLGNDLEDETNQNSDDPQLVKDVAAHLDKLLDLFDKDNTSTLGKELRDAIGDEAADGMYSQFLTLRHQIHWEGDPEGDKYNPTSGYYFDPDDSKYIQSYGQLQKDLQEKGDPFSANEAEKQKTDAFNENTSTTQSTNAASQEMISNDANVLKAVQAFGVAGFHTVMDVISAAVKAAARG